MTVLAFVDFIHPVVADRGKGGMVRYVDMKRNVLSPGQ